ncbi:MAG: CHAP domain-containing protein [Novosphingobium sp.]
MIDGGRLLGAANQYVRRGKYIFNRHFVFASVLFAGLLMSAPAQAHLQCVPYAREMSGIEIHGNARTWWDKASGHYERGREPQVGAVMAMSASRAMPLGHVAVVSKIVDARHILIDQANWAGPGVVEHDVPVEDASLDGDWSEVRVWYAPADTMGARLNPVSGFIYPQAAEMADRDTSGANATFSSSQVTALAGDEDALKLKDASDESVQAERSEAG